MYTLLRPASPRSPSPVVGYKPEVPVEHVLRGYDGIVTGYYGSQAESGERRGDVYVLRCSQGRRV